jgi:hypothetical protein
MDDGHNGTQTELRVLLRDHWQRLDDNDLDRIERDRSALAASLQSRYGLPRPAAEQQALTFLHQHGPRAMLRQAQ